MARILITCWGTLGEVMPFAGFARDLTQAGHEVLVAGPENLQMLFAGANADFCALPPGQREMPVTLDTVRHLFDASMSWERLFSRMLDPYCEAQFQKVHRFIERSAVDAAFCSWITPGAALAAEAAGLPVIRCHLYPQSLFQKTDLPLFTRWWRAMTDGERRLTDKTETRRAIVQHFEKLTPRLNGLAAASGHPPDACGMFALTRTGENHLAFFPASFLRKPEPGCLHLKRTLPKGSGALPEQLVRYLESGPAPVLVALGSVIPAARLDLLRTVARACQAIGERVIFHLGPFNQPIMQTGPDEISVSSIPPTWLMPHVKAVVHHGGMGSLQETLDQALPSVSLPQGFDQLDNAQRLEDLGLGTWVAPSRQTSDAIHRALAQAIGQESNTGAAKRWSQDQLANPDLSASAVVSSLGL